MESNIEFNLSKKIDNWVTNLRAEPSVTESDSEELRSHLLDLIDELKKVGLDEQEAFLIASRRIGSAVDWEEEYKEANNPIVQMRKSLIILAGVLVYFLVYYFIKSTSKLFLLILLFLKNGGDTAVDWVSRYLIGVHFVLILFLASIYFLENKTISFIENVKLKPKHTLVLLLITVVFGIADTCLLPIVKSVIGQNRPLMSHLYEILRYFDFSFPFIICASFILLYFKYYKKAKF